MRQSFNANSDAGGSSTHKIKRGATNPVSGPGVSVRSDIQMQPSIGSNKNSVNNCPLEYSQTFEASDL